jgi:gliding motility-associated-like protein
MIIKFFTILSASLLMIGGVQAQLCQGSLGDPIVNITFGSGGNPGGPLSAAATAYQYVTTDCPLDGYYTVRNNTVNCYSSTWHTLNTDHTGDAGGYFMLVNASFQPSAFYVDTVRGLCGNTTYEFASWIMNMLVPSSCNGNTIQPNITFSIEKTDGTLLQSYNTGNIAPLGAPVWKQYGFYFTTPPAGSDIVLRIVNNAPGGCGNDLTLDDITFRPCGPQITGSINGVQNNAASFCEGTAASFLLSTVVSGGFSNPAFQWQYKDPSSMAWTDIPGANNNSIAKNFAANTPPGVYQLRLAVAEAGNLNTLQCRIYSQPFVFTVNANPVTTATNDGPVCTGSILSLAATGGTQYTWSGPNGFSGSGSSLPLVNIQAGQAGKYYVVVANAAGCIHKDSTTVIVHPTPVATTASANVSVCEGDSAQLTAGGGGTYLWIPAAGLSAANVYNPKASPAATTEYSVVVANQFNCKDTAATLVNIVEKPVADAGPDKVILEGQSIRLSGSVNGQGNNYSWSPAAYIDDIHSLQPIVHPPADMRYILDVVSDAGCGISSDTMFVKVYKDIFVPNAFTPNGDGVNDTWNIPALAAYPLAELAVYSRWGQLVFHTTDTGKLWDGTLKGKPLPMGAYTYFIKLGGRQDMIKGVVLLLR